MARKARDTPAGKGSPARRGAANARQRSAALRAAQVARERRRRRFRIVVAAAVVVVVIAAIVVAVVLAQSHSSGSSSGTASGTLGPEGITLESGTVFAPASGAATGQTVDGIQCNSMEQTAYHIHAHLAIYVDGRLRPVPPGIGVVTPVLQQTPHGEFAEASHCYYWLHTHAQDGIIHIESPTTTTYTLGQFFAIWRQPLSTNQVGTYRQTVTAYVDGKRYTGNPADIRLNSHEDIQLDVGTPAPAPKPVDWSHSQL